MPDILDHEILDELQEFIQDRLPEVVKIYLKNSQTYVENIQSGFASGDAALIRDCAHPLKSSSGSLGLTALSTLCQELEGAAEAVTAGERDLKSLAEMVERVGPLFDASTTQLKAALEA